MPVHLLNAHPIEPHLSGESGWNYVASRALAMLQQIQTDEQTELYLDLFVDRSFLWKPGILPHLTFPWIGVIHHPPYGVPNSCDDLFSNEAFDKALHQCVALIVFTESLQFHVSTLLQLWNLGSRSKCKKSTFNDVSEGQRNLLPPVYHVHHPVNLDFFEKWRGFRSSLSGSTTRKKILHIGHHGREFERFFNLSASGFEKIVLANNLDVPEHVCQHHTRASREWLAQSLYTCGWPGERRQSSAVWTCWACAHQPCRILTRQSVEAYTRALNESIVYIHLVDASAVNTLLECLSLCTPVFVNKLPAVEEVLGFAYPMYCASEVDVSAKLSNKVLLEDLLDKTIDYLSRLDMDRFHIKHMEELLQRIISSYNHKLRMRPVILQLNNHPPGKLLRQGGTQFRRTFRLVAEPAGILAQERRRKLRGATDFDLVEILDLYLY